LASVLKIEKQRKNNMSTQKSKVTIVSNDIIRIADKEVDITRCTGSAVIKIFKIILFLFQDENQKHIGNQLRLLRKINDTGGVSEMNIKHLRKHVHIFMQNWYAGARDMRNLGDLNTTLRNVGYSTRNNVENETVGAGFHTIEGKPVDKKESVVITDRGLALRSTIENTGEDIQKRISECREKIKNLRTRIEACGEGEGDGVEVCKLGVYEEFNLDKTCE
jgi:hypothetical protein